MSFQAVLGTLDLTGLDAFGVQWSVDDSFKGFHGTAASTIRVQQKPRSSGGWAGEAFDGSRHIAVAGLIIATSQSALIAAFDRLNTAASLASTTFTITEEGVTRSMLVRREDEVLPGYLTDVVGSYSIQLVATDSRKRLGTLTGSTRLPSSTGGLSVPFAVPVAIGATSASGQVTLVNVGNVAGPVTLRIDGPVNGPSVTHLGSQRALTFSSSLVLGAGEWLDIDMEARTVLANGQSSRSGYITSRGWSQFEPGANTWSFTATSFTSGALLTVTATPSFK